MSTVDCIIESAMCTPYFHLKGYMNRWWIGTDHHARIHQILRSDEDRHLHDHPWGYTTILLRGGYTEESERGMIDYPEGSVITRKATDAHKLHLPYGEVWTLFILGPYEQGWGFITPEGKVPWRKYLGEAAALEFDSNNPFK